MSLDPLFNEFLSLLVRRKVRFLIVGAHALAAHGRPRATDDFDVWVEPTAVNARRVVDALAEFGYPAYRKHVEEFSSLEKMTHLGVPPFRIDVMTSISGVPSFTKAWTNRVSATIDGVGVQFLGYDDFVTNKRASGRSKDLLDLSLLAEAENAAARTPARPGKRSVARKKTSRKKR